MTMHAKARFTSFGSLSFMIYFQTYKVHNMLAMMLNPCYKSLGLVIQYVSKETTFQIVSEHDK
jgi:hypothetical protein